MKEFLQLQQKLAGIGLSLELNDSGHMILITPIGNFSLSSISLDKKICS